MGLMMGSKKFILNCIHGEEHIFILHAVNQSSWVSIPPSISFFHYGIFNGNNPSSLLLFPAFPLVSSH